MGAEGFRRVLWEVYVRRDGVWDALMYVLPSEFCEIASRRTPGRFGVWTKTSEATYIYPKLKPGEEVGRRYEMIPVRRVG